MEIGTTSGHDNVIAVASMQRNEDKYILEWFSYYLINGVNKFVIYNHMSTDETASTYEKLKRIGYDIEIHYREGYNVHYPMLHHALTVVLPTVDWLIFADMDEFYFPLEGTIVDVLDHFKDYPVSAFGINWCAFGSSGHKVDPPLVLRDFSSRALSDTSTNHHYKSIVKGRGKAGFVHGSNPHIFTTEHGTINLKGQILRQGHEPNIPVVHDIMRINHYQCKSWEYFKTRKQIRGSTADRHPDAPGAQIPDSVFNEYDYNDVKDTSIWDIFGARILKQMDILKEQIS